MTDRPQHTLYICYFGLREPLVQTQVIPYLREIAKAGIKVSLLTFEPELKSRWSVPQIEAMQTELAAINIEWARLAYHKRPSAIATAYDILAGVRFLHRKMDNAKIDVLHGRVHVATLMGAIARMFSKNRPRLIFDIRGFFPEEYTDAGIWPENGWHYRAAKRVEKWLMREADGFVVLTEKAKGILFADETRPVEVIPCCVDFKERFSSVNEVSSEAIEGKLGTKGRFVFAHVGALGGLYLTDEIVDFLEAARSIEPTTFALFLTQTDPSHVTGLLREKGFTESDYFVGQVSPSVIPSYLSVANAGLSFVKATYATQSRSPTKIPEYLAAGLPIIANSGVGDVDKLIADEGVGVLLDGFGREAYLDAVGQLRTLGDISEKCRETAKRRFDLETVGGVRYRKLYEKLLQ
jgi:glycosyltransferase involved in cell wall biosynthesis